MQPKKPNLFIPNADDRCEQILTWLAYPGSSWRSARQPRTGNLSPPTPHLRPDPADRRPSRDACPGAADCAVDLLKHVKPLLLWSTKVRDCNGKCPSKRMVNTISKNGNFRQLFCLYVHSHVKSAFEFFFDRCNPVFNDNNQCEHFHLLSQFTNADVTCEQG